MDARMVIMQNRRNGKTKVGKRKVEVQSEGKGWRELSRSRV